MYFISILCNKNSILMNDYLYKELANFRQIKNFDPKIWLHNKITFLNNYMTKANLKACVINLSGGIDSGCVFAICIEALKQLDTPIEKIIAIIQPIYSTPSHMLRALECKLIATSQEEKVKIIVIDQSQIFDQIIENTEKAINIIPSTFSNAQLKSYMRTPVAYYVTQLLNQIGKPALVLGTSNYDEDSYLGYFCKAGDGVFDLALIDDLHKSEVYIMAKYLNVPSSILNAQPSADLWDGQTDETELGFTYDFVELFTQYINLSILEQNEFKKRLDSDGLQYFEQTSEKIIAIHNKNKHKLKN